jgi:hypothetical protein
MGVQSDPGWYELLLLASVWFLSGLVLFVYYSLLGRGAIRAICQSDSTNCSTGNVLFIPYLNQRPTRSDRSTKTDQARSCSYSRHIQAHMLFCHCEEIATRRGKEILGELGRSWTSQPCKQRYCQILSQTYRRKLDDVQDKR